MVKIKKICPKCNEDIVINKFDFTDKEFEEVNLDELIGLGLDCEYCGIYINLEERWDDEE